MKIENIIRKVLREEQEEEKILKIPGIRYFNNDWNLLQKFLESQGNPRYSIGGNLLLSRSKIETLGNLVRVEGNLNLYYSDVKSLGDLEYVGGWVDLTLSNTESLGNLEYVGNHLNISRTNIESLGNLEYVGGHLDIYKTPLEKKYSNEQIRRMVNVIGHIYRDK
jgi:hypothetical protein